MSLFDRGFSWKSFGKKAELGDRLCLQPANEGKKRLLAHMVENDDGVFIFLPNKDSEYYEGVDEFHVETHLEIIHDNIERLNKEIEKCKM